MKCSGLPCCLSRNDLYGKGALEIPIYSNIISIVSKWRLNKFLNESKDAAICAFDSGEEVDPIGICATSKIRPQARRRAGADGRGDF